MRPAPRGSLTHARRVLLGKSLQRASTDAMSAKRCSRSLLARNSAEVCGPRSISTVSSATGAGGRSSTRGRLCSNFTTRLPLPSKTRLSDFSPSTAAITSASVASMTGSRAVFWLQPATSAFSDSG